MASRKRVDIVMPTEEEDAAITAAAEADPDNPPLTDEQLASMRPFSEVFPELTRGRGPQKAPTKLQVTLRLDRDVVARIKGDDPKGWQVRLNDTLRKAVGLD